VQVAFVTEVGEIAISDLQMAQPGEVAMLQEKQ
jgi:hypothetical protein